MTYFVDQLFQTAAFTMRKYLESLIIWKLPEGAILSTMNVVYPNIPHGNVLLSL